MSDERQGPPMPPPALRTEDAVVPDDGRDRDWCTLGGRRATDKRRSLLARRALMSFVWLGVAMIAVSIVLGVRYQQQAARYAVLARQVSMNTAAVAAAQLGSCERGDVKTVQSNVSELADFQVYSVFYDQLATAPATPERKAQLRAFLRPLGRAIALKSWVQPTDCARALRLGALYPAPPEVRFVTKLPPPSALVPPVRKPVESADAPSA